METVTWLAVFQDRNGQQKILSRHRTRGGAVRACEWHNHLNHKKGVMT